MQVQLGQGSLLELILSPYNLNLSYQKVKANKGSYGIDKLSTEELLPWLLHNRESLVSSLENGKYNPQAEFPKRDVKHDNLVSLR
jgi:retron-type reverse transcriptase